MPVTKSNWKKDSFGWMLSQHLPQKEWDKIPAIAQQLCDKCGHMPEECTCIDDFVASSAWAFMPQQFSEHLSEVLGAFR